MTYSPSNRGTETPFRGGPLVQSKRASEDLNYLSGVDKAQISWVRNQLMAGLEMAMDGVGTLGLASASYEAKRKIISWMATSSAGSGFVFAGPELPAASKYLR